MHITGKGTNSYIGYKYNTINVMGFIATEEVEITVPRVAYSTKLPERF